MVASLWRIAGARRGGRRAAAGVVVALSAWGVAAAHAQAPPVRLQEGRFTVVAWPGDSLLAATLLRAAAGADSFPSLVRPREPVLVTIAPDRRAFRQLVGSGAPEWGAAFAFPGERRIVMQGSGAPSGAGDPRRVLRHELAHVALHEALGFSPPRWFDEGYAGWAAGEWDRDQVIAANLGLALRGFRSLAALDSAFEGSGRQADAAYALAFRAVAELAALDRQRGLALLIEHWKSSGSFDLALRRAYGLTRTGFEARWRQNTRRRYGALALFADVTIGVVVLLLFVTPLYLVRRRRDAARLAALREADALADQRERESALAILLGEVASRDAPRGES